MKNIFLIAAAIGLISGLATAITPAQVEMGSNTLEAVEQLEGQL